MFSIICMNRSYTLAWFTLTASFHDKRHITPEPMFMPWQIKSTLIIYLKLLEIPDFP